MGLDPALLKGISKKTIDTGGFYHLGCTRHIVF
jgi:hypothetical protein